MRVAALCPASPSFHLCPLDAFPCGSASAHAEGLPKMHRFRRALADPLILFVNCSLDRIRRGRGRVAAISRGQFRNGRLKSRLCRGWVSKWTCTYDSTSTPLGINMRWLRCRLNRKDESDGWTRLAP
jgi:hypothetical protein